MSRIPLASIAAAGCIAAATTLVAIPVPSFAGNKDFVEKLTVEAPKFPTMQYGTGCSYLLTATVQYADAGGVVFSELINTVPKPLGTGVASSDGLTYTLNWVPDHKGLLKIVATQGTFPRIIEVNVTGTGQDLGSACLVS